jgi:hypothetical protein
MKNSVRLAIAVAAFAALVTPTAKANASGAVAAAPPLCPTGLVCAWTEPNFTGRTLLLDPSTIGRCWSVAAPEAFNSVWNASSTAVRVWENSFCTGRTAVVNPGSGGNTWFPVRGFGTP